MGALHIKNFPKELKTELKIKALEEKMHFYKLVIEILKKAVGK